MERDTDDWDWIKKQRNNDDDLKDSTIIDPANHREMDDVVNSGETLTDKA
jgi:hypothetical protein